MSAIEHVVEDRALGLRGFLVFDSLRNGRACGGIRIVPDGTLEETRVLAKSMTDKYLLFDFSKSGGVKAVLCVPENAPRGRRKELVRAFGRALRDELRAKRWIPSTDLGSSQEDVDELLAGAGMPRLKIDQCGCGTAWSVFGSILGTADALGLRVSGSTAALEGFGSVGGVLAQELESAGCKVVAVSTSSGALYEPEGLPIGELLRLRDEYDADFIKRAPFRQITSRELLELPVDFLVPGARIHSIAKGVRVRARAVVPAANEPYAQGTAEALSGKGVLCMPAELCYSGGHIGPRLVRYGWSLRSARNRTVAEWRRLVRNFIAASRRKDVLPTEMCDAMIAAQRARLGSAFIPRAFEHALRAQWVPWVVRKAAGEWYVHRRFADLHNRILEIVGVQQ